jgi:hypothetical protein
MAHNSPLDVPRLLKNLNREEKVKLLAGDTTWTTAAIDRLAIPAITVSALSEL